MPTIPELPPADAVAGEDLVAIDDGTTTFKATADMLLVRVGEELQVGTDASYARFGLDGSWELTRGAGGYFRFDIPSGSVNMALPGSCSFHIFPTAGPILIDLKSEDGVELQIGNGFISWYGPMALYTYESATGLGGLTHRLPVYDAVHGGLLGYIPIYDDV